MAPYFNWNCRIINILTVLFVISHANGHRLNVPRIMLPYLATTAVNFTLEASNGCYLWRSLNTGVAVVQPIDVKPGRDCSTRAVVTAVSTHPTQKTTVVYAEEEGSGLSLRCDVIVDKIVFIDIVTTTRILYLGDSPEEFEVRALDDKGNTFSSLRGLEFEWSLLSDDTAHTVIDAKSILKFVAFQDSKYTALEHIAKFETKDKQGERILIEGLRAGSARVETRLRAAVFKDVQPSVVRLIVIDHLMLNPSQDIYILVHCQVQFYVEKLRQGKVTVLTMPSNQYYLEVANGTVATLDASTSVMTGLALGKTNVTLKDNNIREVFSLPSTVVHVIEPKYLGFVVFPGNNWVLQKDEWYEIMIEVYDRDSNKMFPANVPNLRIETLFPAEYFEVKQSTLNGSHHYVRTKMSGVTEIEASLVSVVKPDGEKVLFEMPISETQEVEIYDAVKVIPDYLGFPWLPSCNNLYSYRLKATGGTGTYIWSSSDLAVGTVNVQGTFTTGKEIGRTIVTAADSRNTAHFGTCRVHVLSPSELQFLDTKVEAGVGDEIHLPLAMFGEVLEDGKRVRISMSDCSMVPLKTSIVDEGVFQTIDSKEDIELPPGACTFIHVRALTAGHTQVRVLLDQVEPTVEAMVTIAAYNKLLPLSPESVATVTPGSSKTVVFQGGPQPWVLDNTHYFERLTAEKEDYLSIKRLKSRGVRGAHIFQVTCLKKGQQALTAEVGNEPSSRNKYPAVSSASIQFRCAEPVSLQVIPMLVRPLELEEPCPVALDANGQIPVMNNNDIEFEVRGVDGEGNIFDNSSSLIVKWSSSNSKLATFDSPTMTYTDMDGEIAGSKIVKAVQVATLGQGEGPVTLTATCSSYDTGLMHKHNMQMPSRINPISSSVDLLLVSEAVMEPATISIFNHPSNKAEITLKGGSGHFLLRPEPRGLAEVVFNEKTKKIKVTPLKDGKLSICAIDLCLATTRHATAQVNMAGVSTIELTVFDKVQIDHDITAEVRVLDSTGQPLSVTYFPLMNLRPLLDSDIIEVRPDQTKEADLYKAYYTVHGSNLGFTNLAFTATSKSGQQISSRVRDIQVFPPLRLSPRNVTLIVGEEFQIRNLGGPQPLSDVEYSNSDEQICTIDSSGIIDALTVGHSVLTGTASGFDPDVGADVDYSTDVVNVFVIELGGVQIRAPLNRLETGTLMPAYAMGLSDHETPFTFGDATPGIQFYWTSSNTDVIRVESVYHGDGVETTPEDSVGVRVRTINPGEATLKLQVTLSPQSRHQASRNSLLTDEIRIEVFERLVMLESCDCRLLMAPDTQAMIRTNRDGSAVMSYSVLSTSGSDPIVTVNSQGYVTSASRTGKAVVEVIARESFRANQTILALVQVKPVSYLAVEPATHLTTSRELKVYPVGLPLAFTVGFYDNIGEKFDATNVKVAHRLHRFDHLQLQAGPENSTFTARAAQQGTTIFKVWDEDNPRIDDYVSIPVGNVLEPVEKDFVVGEVISMNSALAASEGKRVIWSSSDESVLSIRPDGLATAVSPGKVTLSMEIGHNAVTSREVVVGPITRVVLQDDDSTVSYISNLPNQEDIRVPVLLNGRGCFKGAAVRSQWVDFEVPKPPFSCHIDFTGSQVHAHATEWFHTYAGYDTNSGNYYCAIQKKEMRNIPQFLSTLDTQLNLYVTVHRTSGQTEVRSASWTIPFYPGFYVHQTEVVLSFKQKKTEIVVEGVESVLRSLQVTTNNTELLAISKPFSSGAPNVLHYNVMLKDLPSSQFAPTYLQSAVEIRSSLTEQSLLLPVKLNLVPVFIPGEKETVVVAGWSGVFQVIANNYQNWILVLILILAIAGAVLLGYHLVLAPRYYAPVVGPNASAFLHSPVQGAPPPYVVSPSPGPYGGTPSTTPYQRNDSSFRRRQPHSPTKLWSASYGPQEGGSPKYN